MDAAVIIEILHDPTYPNPKNFGSIVASRVTKSVYTVSSSRPWRRSTGLAERLG